VKNPRRITNIIEQGPPWEVNSRGMTKIIEQDPPSDCHWMTNIIEQGLTGGVNGHWKTNIIEQGPPWEVNFHGMTLWVLLERLMVVELLTL